MQSPLLHTLLPAFVGEWVRAAPGTPACFVDAFAGAEWNLGAGEPAAEGSRAAAAAVAAAEGGAACLLVEEDPALMARLRLDLRRRAPGLTVREGAGAAELAPGEVGLLEADFRDVADAAAAAPEGTRLLLCAAPPAARRIPWPLLEAVLAAPAAELLFRFPAADFVRQGALDGPLADLPPIARRRLEGCSALLGDDRHGWVAGWRATQRTYGVQAALEAVLEGFMERLAVSASGRLVKPVSLAGGERVILVTGEPMAALGLNAAVVETGAAAAADPSAGGDLLSLLDDPGEVPRPDPAPALAEHWLARHRGEAVPLAVLLAGIASTGATYEDVRRALGRLRRTGQASYDSLRRSEAVVTFPATPVPPPRLRRAPRPAPCGDLFESAYGA